MTLSDEMIEQKGETFTHLVDVAGEAAWNNACHWAHAHGDDLKIYYRAMIGSAIAAVLPSLRKQVLQELVIEKANEAGWREDFDGLLRANYLRGLMDARKIAETNDQEDVWGMIDSRIQQLQSDKE